jgi:hypothetical protein
MKRLCQPFSCVSDSTLQEILTKTTVADAWYKLRRSL